MHLANKSLKNDVQILIFALLILLPLQSTASTFIRQRRHLLEFRQTKGQLISKGLLGVFKSTKKPVKSFKALCNTN